MPESPEVILHLARSLICASSAHEKSGEIDESLQLCNQATELLDGHTDENLLTLRENTTAAQARLSRTIRTVIVRSAPDLALATDLITKFHRNFPKCDHAAGLRLLEDASTALAKDHCQALKVDLLMNFGTAYYYIGNFQKSIAFYRESQSLAVAIGINFEDKVALADFNMSFSFRDDGNLVEAKCHMESALTYDRLEHTPLATATLGDIHRRLGQLEQARALCLEASSLDFTHLTKCPLCITYTELYLGEALRDSGQLEAALQHVSASLRAVERDENAPKDEISRAHAALGKVHLLIGNKLEAELKLREATAEHIRAREYLQQSIQGLTRTVGVSHPDVIEWTRIIRQELS